MKQSGKEEKFGCLTTLMVLGFSILLFGPLSILGFLLIVGFLSLFKD